MATAVRAVTATSATPAVPRNSSGSSARTPAVTSRRSSSSPSWARPESSFHRRGLERVQEIAHDHGALLIADEVQTGYGRTGELFASSHFDVEPDILTQAKGIANGLPLGAFTASEEIADAFESGDHLSTFGGNPVACAAALATIDELQDGIVDNAREQGQWLESELAALEDEYDVVGQARGLGLMRGIELVEPGTTGPQNVASRPDSDLASAVSEHLREESNVVIGVGGYYKNVMRFQPPLSISREQTRVRRRRASDGARDDRLRSGCFGGGRPRSRLRPSRKHRW